MNLLNRTNLMCVGAVAYCSYSLSQLLFLEEEGEKLTSLFLNLCAFSLTGSLNLSLNGQ